MSSKDGKNVKGYQRKKNSKVLYKRKIMNQKEFP